MIDLSYALRSKPSWWTKFKDPAIRTKWKEEALQHVIRDGKLSEAEVEWVLDELEDYATMRDNNTGIQPSCHVRIYESDKLIPEQLKSTLVTAASVFENVPEAEKDWHPRSDNMVLDLVHPSLFCTVYGRTLAWTTDSDGKRHLGPLKPPAQDQDSWSYSEKFSWISTDFQLSKNGEPAKALGYINNVHPEQHKALVSVIEGLVGRFSLLWDKVLTDHHSGNDGMLPDRRVVGMYKWKETETSLPRPTYKDYEELGSEEYNRRYRAWEQSRAIVVPTVGKQGYRESGNNVAERRIEYSIQGKQVQVIVKLANIHLSPEKPEYPGGKWHVEGMANERIVASGIYYYDCENITESQLAFRQAVSFGPDADYEQSDGLGIKLTWGLEEGNGSNQVVGAVKTSADRCIAFPNIYQHQVSSFKLVDPSKPGHRKIVALFLVDPEHRIPSTTDIPPQQAHWTREAVFDSFIKEQVKVPLPVELVDMVADHVDNVMTMEEAKTYREQLMDERTAFVGVVDEQHFATEFSFCEH
ncbi:hypothetical protein FRC04_003211 [Tulasnella sp. 424]|nr:hypothetical protein FRC04_003211 [Tulasnella sp. 424]KAG8966228.1 hypothetical protein FRC05_002767 [Tulasnella sp. 425]